MDSIVGIGRRHHGTTARFTAAVPGMTDGGAKGRAFSQQTTDQPGAPLGRRRVPRQRRGPPRTLRGRHRKRAGLPSPDGWRTAEGDSRHRRQHQRIRDFPGIVAGARAAMARLVLAAGIAAAAGGPLAILQGLPRATAQRAGDHEGQQAGEDGGDSRHHGWERLLNAVFPSCTGRAADQARRSSPLTPPPVLPTFPPDLMAEIHTADLSSLDTDALKSRLTQLGRYL